MSGAALRTASAEARAGAKRLAAATPGRVDVQIAAHPAPAAASLRGWARAALGDQAGALCIRIVGEAESQALNLRFRGKPHATNVLAFPTDAPGVLGDLAICAPVVEREAGPARQALAAHFAHLVVHGVLHLRGMDHEHDAQAARMARAEARILNTLGFADPYAQP